MQAIDRILDKTKSFWFILISTLIYSNTKIYKVFITNIYSNSLFSRFFNSITESFILIPWYLEKKQVRLIKKNRYFNYKKKEHIIHNYLKKEKIIAILEGISQNSNI